MSGWDVGSNKNLDLSPPKSCQNNGWKRASCVTNTCVKGSSSSITRTHRSSFVFKESVTHHATPSCRTGGSGAPYSTQYTRQTTTQCHWGLGGQQTSKQQATNKQANTKSAVDHINILFVSFIHTYKSIINGENHHHHHQHHRLTKLLSVIEVVVVVRLEWY